MLRYLIFDKIIPKFRKSRIQYFEYNDIPLTEKQFLTLREFVENFLDDVNKQVIDNLVIFKIKGNRNGRVDSINRFMALGYALDRFRPMIFLETGTQHGITAAFVEAYSKILNLKLEIITCDVIEDNWTLPGQYKKYYLTQPARKNFLKLLVQLKKTNKNILFFHDSDHSFENMKYEFSMVNSILTPRITVSDDVTSNYAFEKIFSSTKFYKFKAKYDFGPTVGVAIRKTRDPDGT